MPFDTDAKDTPSSVTQLAEELRAAREALANAISNVDILLDLLGVAS